MKKSDLVLWFKDLRREDIPLAGGKCANLGELFGQVGVPVPNGFAVSANAYRVFLEQTGAEEKIGALLADVDTADIKSLQDVSRKIRKYVESRSMPKEIEKAVLEKACREMIETILLCLPNAYKGTIYAIGKPPELLAERITFYASHLEALHQMALRAKELGCPNAAVDIIDDCYALVG